jgi:hypothetical protein
VSSEARKAFLQGAAFESAPVEKSVKDEIQFSGALHFAFRGRNGRSSWLVSSLFSRLELGSFKERFEKGPIDEAPAEKTAVDVRCAELGNIKANFEKVSCGSLFTK